MFPVTQFTLAITRFVLRAHPNDQNSYDMGAMRGQMFLMACCISDGYARDGRWQRTSRVIACSDVAMQPNSVLAS